MSKIRNGHRLVGPDDRLAAVLSEGGKIAPDRAVDDAFAIDAPAQTALAWLDARHDATAVAVCLDQKRIRRFVNEPIECELSGRVGGRDRGSNPPLPFNPDGPDS